MKKLFYLVLIIFVGISCSKRKRNSSERKVQKITPENKILIQSYKYLKSTVGNTILDQNMEVGVGPLLIIDPLNNQNMHSCTWFLIDQGMAMTNSHCIPKELINNKNIPCGTTLAGKIKINSSLNVDFFCKNIVYSTKVNNNLEDPDFAVIELDHWKSEYNNAILPITREGFADGSPVKVLGTKTNKLTNGQLFSNAITQECVSIQESMVGNYFSDFSLVLPIFKKQESNETCQIPKESAGAPVMINGKVAGVSFMQIDQDLTMPDTKSNMATQKALITNLSCIDIPNIKVEQFIENNDCEIINSDKAEKKKHQARLIMEANKEHLKPILINSNHIFIYKLSLIESSKENRPNMLLKPICIKDYKKWNRRDKKNIKRSENVYRDEFVMEIKMKYDYTLDYYGKLGVASSVVDTTKSLFEVEEIKSFIKRRRGLEKVNMSYYDENLFLNPVVLDKCTQTQLDQAEHELIIIE